MNPNRLEDLRQRIVRESDQLLFDEATKCLDAKACRAAYIISWINVAESLRTKLEVMAPRDSAIGRIIGQVHKAEREGRSTDNLLLTSAKDLGLVTTEEFKKLDHIREMRNLYAHPTGAGPSEDEVVAALRIGVDAVLSKPALLRHGYVKELMRTLYEDRHFLDDVPAVVREYAVGVAHRVHQDVAPYLLEQLMERLEAIIGDPEVGIFERRGREFGTAFLVELRASLTSAQWDLLRVAQQYPTAASIMFSVPEIWTLLPNQSKDMVFGHLIEPVKDGKVQSPSPIGLQRARSLAEAGLLTERQKERLGSAMAGTPMSTLRTARVPLAEYAQRLIEALKSYNWYTQNPACELLAEVGPDECAQLDDSAQEQLGRNILQSAEGKARSCEFFISSIARTKTVWPRRFVEGLLLESLVDDDGKFRLKDRHLVGAIMIAGAHPEASTIFRNAVAAIRKSTAKYNTQDYEAALARIEEFKEEDEEGVDNYLGVLERAIKTAKSSQAD